MDALEAPGGVRVVAVVLLLVVLGQALHRLELCELLVADELADGVRVSLLELGVVAEAAGDLVLLVVTRLIVITDEPELRGGADGC
ncbi:hypothetical protein [Myxococcus stipitatus]|uniref:hypothetical protein n=1 Tax=Myxococcus stipitatus TaxID=83455 RepID=UPI001184C2CD|nr:hypothetical protein [Myxococcus stipitatus]